MRHKSAFSWAAFAAFTLTASAASATVMMPLSVESMSTKSDLVARGRVVSQQAAWGQHTRKIYTFTEIQVLSTVHSKAAAPQTIVVRSLGGEVGDIGMKVAGTPKFTEGEEVFVFLRVDPLDAGQFQVIGMAQGKFRVDRSAEKVVAVPSIEGLAFVRPAANGTLKVADGERPPERVLLSDLELRVRKALEAPTAPSAPKTAVPMAPSAPRTPAVIGQ